MRLFWGIYCWLSFVLTGSIALSNLRGGQHIDPNGIKLRCDPAPLEETSLLPEDEGKVSPASSTVSGRRMTPYQVSEIWIPVVFHILRSDSGKQGDVPLDNLKESIKTLNEAHRGFKYHGKTIDTKFRFFLQGVNLVNNNYYYRNCKDIWHEIRTATVVRQESVLNIWSCQMQTLGFSFLPKQGPSRQGCFINRLAFPEVASTNYRPYSYYSRGYTVVHEVGHFLGLLHTFDGGCDGEDALDTAPEAQPYFGMCDPYNPERSAPKTCSGNSVDPINNFMDYSMDACMIHFTQGQADRMMAQVLEYKPHIAAMDTKLQCVASGEIGPGTQYGLCQERRCLHTRMPNGQYPPQDGWCHLVGTDNSWSSCCCPGSCPSMFDNDAVRHFPPIHKEEYESNKGVKEIPEIQVWIPEHSCTGRGVHSLNKAARICSRAGSRLCLTSEVLSGTKRSDAIIRAPSCQNRFTHFGRVWVADSCRRNSESVLDLQSEQTTCIPNKRKRRQLVVCCRTE